MTKEQKDVDVSVEIPMLLGEVTEGSAISEAYLLVQHAKIHLKAMLEVLRSVHPAHKIEAGLYLGNLQNIYDRMERLLVIVEQEFEWG